MQSHLSRFWHWLMSDKPCPYCGSTETRDETWQDYDYSFAIMNPSGDGWLVEPTPTTVEVLTCLACGGRS